ncbi:MAG: zinc ABC transporter substrate-binding protein [Aliishimia sp.]
MLYYYKNTLTAFTLFLMSAPLVRAEAPQVVADIAPVHALVSRVMQGVGTPDLLLPPGTSPHGYALRPSQARSLTGADLVVWIGPELTPWLDDALQSLASDTPKLSLLKAPDTLLFQFRETAIFDDHDDHDEKGHDDHDDHDDHDEKGHDDHDEHAHDDHDDHEEKGHDDHDEHGDDDHDKHDDHDKDEGHDEAHDDHDHHDHDGVDPHAWLDPENAKLWLDVIAAELSAQDPENAATYAVNAQAGQDEIDLAVKDLTVKLATKQDQGFIVFHDAYQYFEARFGLKVAGAFQVSDAVAPGAARVAALRDRVAQGNIACIFTEPQFNPDTVRRIGEAANLKVAVLDPMGAHLDPGSDLYVSLLRSMAGQIADCL